MRRVLGLVFAFGIVGSCPLVGAEPADFTARPFQMRDDFGWEPLSDCVLQYYYDVPCPTYSWFWAYSGPCRGDIVGAFFNIGDMSTGTGQACDPADCMNLQRLRVLDFGGYGDVYPGLFSVEFDVYCSNDRGCPIGPSLWNSGACNLIKGWNYIDVEPLLNVCGCAAGAGPPPSQPRILITATHTGSDGFYPIWGFDNIGTAVYEACDMHDVSCLPALYPRPYTSHYSTIHSGYYGWYGLEYCPPIWFADGWDTSYPDGMPFGFVEIAWRIYFVCSGPTSIEPGTWGSIKSMFR